MRTFSVRGVCHAGPLNDGLLWLYNASANLALSVFEINAYPAGGGSSAVDANFDMPRMTGKQQLVRVSDFAGGTSFGFVDFVSGSAAMPAAVKAIANADSYTGGDVFRQVVDGTYFSSTNNATGSLAMTRRHLGAGRRGRGKQRTPATIWAAGDANVAPIVLAEGEGLAITQAAFFIPEPRIYRFILRDVATGACYQASIKAMPATQKDEAVALVYNGVGSGVALAVEQIELDALGEYWGTIATRVSPGPWIRVVWCNRIRVFTDDPSQGELTAVAHRSDAPLPAGAVTITRGPFQPMLPGNEASYLSAPGEMYDTHGTVPAADVINARQQVTRDCIRFWRAPAYGKDASAASYLPNCGPRAHNRCGEAIAWSSRGSVNVDSLVLYPGDGIAIASYNSAALLNTTPPDGAVTCVYDLGVTFGLQPQSGASPRLPRINV